MVDKERSKEEEELWKSCACGCGESIKYAHNYACWLPESVWTYRSPVMSEDRKHHPLKSAALNPA
jgi:hypothetical protein